MRPIVAAKIALMALMMMAAAQTPALAEDFVVAADSAQFRVEDESTISMGERAGGSIVNYPYIKVAKRIDSKKQPLSASGADSGSPTER